LFWNEKGDEGKVKVRVKVRVEHWGSIKRCRGRHYATRHTPPKKKENEEPNSLNSSTCLHYSLFLSDLEINLEP